MTTRERLVTFSLFDFCFLKDVFELPDDFDVVLSMNIDNSDQRMGKLVSKPFAFLEIADHLVKPLIGTGMLRIKLLHPLMALPDCFFIFGYLGVHLRFSLEIFRLCDAGQSVLLIQPELYSLELFRLLLQIADCIGTF